MTNIDFTDNEHHYFTDIENETLLHIFQYDFAYVIPKPFKTKERIRCNEWMDVLRDRIDLKHLHRYRFWVLQGNGSDLLE